MTREDEIAYFTIKKYSAEKSERFRELATRRVNALLGRGSFTICDLDEMDRIYFPYFHFEVNKIPLEENER